MIDIGTLDADAVDDWLFDLADLLADAVASGASVGYVEPFDAGQARAFWRGVQAALSGGHRRLLIATEADRLLGTVQLDLEDRPNGRHRATVMKLLVHTTARRRGIALSLMAAAERLARDAGRTLLVLDTRSDSPAQRLYEGLGYRVAGVIPRYALSTGGVPEDTTFMFKEL